MGHHSPRKSDRVCCKWLFWQVVQDPFVLSPPPQQTQMGDKWGKDKHINCLSKVLFLHEPPEQLQCSLA